MTTKNVTALIINDLDSTCFDAALSAGHFTNSCNQEFAAVPSCYGHAVRVTSVARKHFPDYVCLEFPDGTEKRITSYIDSSAEAAIKEAISGFAEDGKDINDIEWWEDVD